MWKVIKLIVGLLIICGIGLIYGRIDDGFNDAREMKNYSHISFEFPGGEISTIQIKEIPKSKCNKIREEYFNAMREKCTACKVIVNECQEKAPELFIQAVKKVHLEMSYVFKPFIYPEVTFMKGFPKDAFLKVCEMEKQSLSTSVCVE
jgi:hypothetical protein